MSRASKQLGTNVTKKLMTEMQALIAFACYDSPAIAQGGDSMTEHSMAESMTALYFGGDDPEIISYLDQFINGLHRFTGLFTSSEPDEFGQIILTMPQKLHRHGGLNIFVGPTSITKELLSKKNFANNEKIAGRTLLKKAKDVVATCKKMMGLVTASGSPYRDGTFPSGTNWDDYIKWCLVAMWNECDREAKAKLVNVATTESAGATTTTTTTTTLVSTAGETACCAVATATTTTTETAAAMMTPSGSFFKVGVGFLAWALWGHIPLHDGEQMLSHLFSAVKANTSFGRGTSTRSAMRKALLASSVAPVDNRRGKKRDANTMLCVDSTTLVRPADAHNREDFALLTKTLEHLSAEAMEKEEKQQHHMCVRLVRDKLAARRRRSEVLLQQLTLSSKYKKRPDATLFDKMESNEEEIEKLEHELANLQERECQRHREMMEKRRTMSCVATMIGMNPIGISGSFESSGNESGGNDSSSTPRNVGMTNNDDDMTAAYSDVVQTSSDVENIQCMECKLIPTNHLCLKCKVVRVCACCCDANRGLHNITWCKTCFETETPTSQQTIRDGDYNYRLND